MTTNDIPGCPNKGGLLSGTDERDVMNGKNGEDEIHSLGTRDYIAGGLGSDVLYGGDGNDRLDGATVALTSVPTPLVRKQRDELYCGEGKDHYIADKLDYVDSSCEVKQPPANR